MQRTDINGLKALAIISVVLLHFFDIYSLSQSSPKHPFAGGLIGFDIFFVVSGYLITSSILKRLDDGSFIFNDFLCRKVFRILPPLSVVTFLCIVFGYFLLYPKIYMELSKEILSTYATISNYRFANTGGYFSLSSVDKVLLHTWYICIIMHFYLLYPPLLLIFYKLLSRNLLKYAVLILFIVFFTVAVIYDDNDKAYLVTHCRFFEPMYGCVICLFREPLKKLLAPVPSWIIEVAGVSIVFYALFTTELETGFYTVHTSFLPMLASALILLNEHKQSLLGNRVLNIIGKYSYTIYLSHWPIFVFLARTGHFNSSIPLVLAISFLGMVIFSFFFERHQLPKIMALLLIVLSVMPYMQIKNTFGENYVSIFMSNDALSVPKVTNPPYRARIYGDITLYEYGQRDPDIFIIGDSHAEQYKTYLDDSTLDGVYFAFSHATMAYGGWILNSKCHFHHVDSRTRRSYYRLYTDTLERLTAGSKVVLANNWIFYAMEHECQGLHKISDERFKVFLSDMNAMFDETVKKYRHLNFYLVGQGIYTSQTIASCTLADFKDSFLSHIFNQSYCTRTIDYHEKYTKLINESFKAYADSRDNVKFIDRNEPLRNGEFYLTTDNGRPLFMDNHHYTPYGGRFILDYILKSLK